MRQVSTVFVHGIAQTRAARQQMDQRFLRVLERFKVRDSVMDVSAATWRSSGRFDYDLDLLYRVDGLREDAIEDVADRFRFLNQTQESLLIVGHSMGQPLALTATRRVDWQIPFSFLSLGGPLGNTNPVFKSYLAWAATGPLQTASEWFDVWNPDDPVCSNIVAPSLVLGKLPTPPEFLHSLIDRLPRMGHDGPYTPYQNAKAIKLDVPGRFNPGNPFAEHSSYFESRPCWDLFSQMRDKLASV